MLHFLQMFHVPFPWLYCIFQVWSFKSFLNYQETLLVKVFELSVYHAVLCTILCWLWMQLHDTGYLQCTRCENSQIFFLGYFLYVPVSLDESCSSICVGAPVHNFALVWVELQLPVSRPDTEGVKIFLEISSNFYISYMSPYFSIISRYWFLSSPAGH